MSDKIEMWKKAISFLQDNGFKSNKEDIKWYNMVDFRNSEHKGLIVKVYEGRVLIGTCFSPMVWSFESIISYSTKNYNQPILSEEGYKLLVKDYPIVKDIVDLVMDRQLQKV